MLPLVDAHVHLLAGLDDGPRTKIQAREMCRAASADGIRLAAALAHQNDHWPDVTPERIRTAAKELAADLLQADVDLEIVPSAEVMVHADLVESFKRGKLLTVGDRGQFVLLEMPHDLYVDIRDLVVALSALGIRAILAHPERTPALLHEPGIIENLIELGCLIQVSARSVTQPANTRDERAMKDWLRRGVVHLLGSDGHSLHQRPPRISTAVDRIRRWAGLSAADRIGSINGQLVLRGVSFKPPSPVPPSRRWWALIR